LLTLVFTWPLPLHASTHVIGPFYGDNLEYVWKVWWVRDSLFERHASPWFVPHIYWPYGYDMAYGEITPLHTVLMLPINLLLGEVWTYNLAILLSIWLSAWLTYLWMLDFTEGQEGPAFVAGLIFTFCPYRMARIAGHLPLVSTQGIPLVLWGMERFWRRHRLGDGLLIALGVIVSALSSWYYALALALLSPLYWLVRARPWRIWLGNWRFWRGIGLAGLVTACAVLPFVLLYKGVAGAGAAKIPLEEADFWSASLLDYILPNWRHPLWGNSVRQMVIGGDTLPPYEFLLGLGYSSGLLAVLGARYGRHPARKALIFWTVGALGLSLGLSLHLIPGWPLRVPLPSTWADRLSAVLTWIGVRSLAGEPFSLNVGETTVIPLPALLVRWFVIGGVGLRSWGRFALFAVLGVAALAALGLVAMEKRVGQSAPDGWRRNWPALVVGLLVLFEFYTGPQSLIRVGPRPVDEWLARQPDDFAIVQMPLDVALSGPQMFYSRYHGKNVIGGYGTYFPILFEERYPELSSFPSDASIELLERWPVHYVLVDRNDFPSHPGLAEAIIRQPRLRRTVTLGGVDVYEIVVRD
jgi:hypothetical protein